MSRILSYDDKIKIYTVKPLIENTHVTLTTLCWNKIFIAENLFLCRYILNYYFQIRTVWVPFFDIKWKYFYRYFNKFRKSTFATFAFCTTVTSLRHWLTNQNSFCIKYLFCLLQCIYIFFYFCYYLPVKNRNENNTLISHVLNETSCQTKPAQTDRKSDDTLAVYPKNMIKWYKAGGTSKC